MKNEFYFYRRRRGGREKANSKKKGGQKGKFGGAHWIGLTRWKKGKYSEHVEIEILRLPMTPPFHFTHHSHYLLYKITLLF